MSDESVPLPAREVGHLRIIEEIFEQGLSEGYGEDGGKGVGQSFWAVPEIFLKVDYFLFWAHERQFDSDFPASSASPFLVENRPFRPSTC